LLLNTACLAENQQMLPDRECFSLTPVQNVEKYTI